MAATLHVVCGPARAGKTRYLLERYRAVTRSAAGAALWLGPTHRSVEGFRPHLLGERGGCLAPHLFTFQDFAEEIIRCNDPAARPLSEVQRRLLIEALVTQLHARGELTHFQRVIDTRGFVEAVSELVAELKRNEIRPEQFTLAVSQLRASAVRFEDDGEENRPGPGRKDHQCALLYSEYQQRLVRHNFYDLEGRLWYARDLLARGHRSPFEAVRATFVSGFTDFTRTQRDIFEALCQWLDELWLALPIDPDEGRAELFSGPQAVLQHLQHLNPRIEYLARSTGRSEAAHPKPAPALSGRSMLPAGLAHVERQLFRPLRTLIRSADAEGLACIEAPGVVGETRLVAREIKTLLISGVCADDILVTVRDLLPYADLVREVFGEYGLPVDIEGMAPLTRNPAVTTLLRAFRLPDEDWPFAGVTALLRSSYFRPDWPETRADSDLAQYAEALLRLLGEPRGRAAYLRATDLWADRPPPGLEDEQAEESRRLRTHQLAVRCRPFLRRFFTAWHDLPAKGTLTDFGAWLRHFADAVGLTRAAAEDPRDAAALARLWDELGQWARIERLISGSPRPLERGQFFRTLLTLTAMAGLARTPRGPGRVRVLSAELARGLQVPYVFVMGLGERSFPRLTAPEPFFDEQERQAFRQAGLDFSSADDLMPAEMLLFYLVVTRASRRLVVSYPAVDEKGQALLPSSFLQALLDCFQPGAIPVLRRRMLIESYDRDQPLSPAEYRVRAAGNLAAATPLPAALAADLRANLVAAADLARLRFREKTYTPYDGLFRNPAVIAELHSLFGPQRVFSPTALEDYIACPFRFFLGHVLHLEPLEEPREEIESTDRGLAFHRALSRLHKHLREAGIHQPTEVVDRHLPMQLHQAVEECAVDASPASAALWRLEGQRLLRVALRYRSHWARFREPWLTLGVEPQPHFFEIDFGLPSPDGSGPTPPLIIRMDGVEVRISGRIDRVDIAQLSDGVGFWIIDYKTGRSSHYTGADLKEFRRLQLTLYALAVEEVLLAGQGARPLGLAYWLVTDTGPKVALPAYPKQLCWLEETDRWREVRRQLEQWVVLLVSNIRQGAFPLKPRSERCTETCDFCQMCRIAQSRSVEKTWELPLPTVP